VNRYGNGALDAGAFASTVNLKGSLEGIDSVPDVLEPRASTGRGEIESSAVVTDFELSIPLTRESTTSSPTRRD
jgi:hypothetical protein